MEYTITKFVHVTLAIVAVGFNLSYGIWIARSASDPEHIGFVMRTIRWIDARLANPAYAVLLITGLFMAFDAGYPLTTFWIAAALVLYALAAFLGVALIAPNFRAQLRALETAGPASDAFRRAASRGRALGLLVSLDVIAIVLLMVAKPTR
ncbi:MAG TPA: DUF2269 family protein [Candidatus Limnocylindria bacterium]|nr:DUF2269 family protein [Candidatus Limnocylindria bacterium]